jgi:hypothetical protein
LSVGDRAEADAAIAAAETDLQVIAAAVAPHRPVAPKVPDFVSATSWIRLGKDEIGPWDLVRPLPDRPTRARRLGTEVHRMIEERSRGIAAFPDEGELDEPGEVTGGGLREDLLSHWEASGYGGRTLAVLPSGEPMVELPFTLKRDGRFVRGRIDAVYESPDGLEIVDFKTGRRFDVDDANDQLALYAEALDANGLIPTGARVTLSYVFLDGGPPVTRAWARA